MKKRMKIGFNTESSDTVLEESAELEAQEPEESWEPRLVKIPGYEEENDNRLSFFINQALSPSFRHLDEAEKLGVIYNIAYYVRTQHFYTQTKN